MARRGLGLLVSEQTHGKKVVNRASLFKKNQRTLVRAGVIERG
jgi:hypothetical protein